MDGFLIAACDLGETNGVAVLAADGYLVWWVGLIIDTEDGQAFTWDPGQEPRRVPVSAVLAGEMFDGDNQLNQYGAEWFALWLETQNVI